MSELKPFVKLTVPQKALIKAYKPFFTNTGGNDVVELLQRSGVNFHNNYIVASLQVAALSQLQMLEGLQQKGMLK